MKDRPKSIKSRNGLKRNGLQVKPSKSKGSKAIVNNDNQADPRKYNRYFVPNIDKMFTQGPYGIILRMGYPR